MQTTRSAADWPQRSLRCAWRRTVVWASMKQAGVLCWVRPVCVKKIVFINAQTSNNINTVVCDAGPMVYGICFCPISKKDDMKNLKVAGNAFLNIIYIVI